jgi:hypothetical protein
MGYANVAAGVEISRAKHQLLIRISILWLSVGVNTKFRGIVLFEETQNYIMV